MKPRSPTRRQSQRPYLSRFLQSQESRQAGSWLIFDVGQRTMAAETFQQDRQFSTEKFILQENVLVVVGGVPPEKSIPLTRISPVYECIERRFHSGYLVPLFLAAMSGAVAWRLSQGDLSLIRAIVAGIVACMALFFPFMMRFAPVEGAKFLDRDGAPLFEIYRPMKSAYTYDEFISLLVQRVKEATAQRFNP